MKPFRAAMVQELVLAYGLDEGLNFFLPRDAHFEELALFHSPEYIRFLKTITPESVQKYQKDCQRFCVGDDCPIFPSLYDYLTTAAGGSLACASHLIAGLSDVSISYMGGLHHAKMAEASGFCYVNDIVLGIIELLKVYKRVLYIDIDIHHGDGVEEAFYCTNRVMTLSFHKYGKDFFPGTGAINDRGAEQGLGYAVNVPLDDAIDDDSFLSIFKPIMADVMQFYRPEAIVLQCGADSLAGDRLGCFNLTLRGHGACIEFVKKFGLPLIILGGGGYTLRNVARCWTYETSLIVGKEISEQIPANAFYEYYGPEFTLPIMRTNMENQNKAGDLEEKVKQVKQQLKNLSSAPNAMQDGFNELPLAVTRSAQVFSKNSDYAGGIITSEDMNGQHEGEGVSEGMRQKIKEERVENAANDIDKGKLEEPQDWVKGGPEDESDSAE
ncbi:Histone_deacetylase [Hexamita inflata]|uniref:Histone deacetylase n=1 Tax=Hexamita inflata TaxID=28002 RepID=A0AA86TUY4_9EUKA|nr:Histone deacetylase [Hexamita inflata]